VSSPGPGLVAGKGALNDPPAFPCRVKGGAHAGRGGRRCRPWLAKRGQRARLAPRCGGLIRAVVRQA
jgi:hypothetical protein